MERDMTGWTVAWAKRRIKAHWRAASKAESAERRAFHMAQADQWRNLMLAIARGRAVPNVAILDRFRPDPA